MSGKSYNGYDWKQRGRITNPLKKALAERPELFAGRACELCGDPDRDPNEWHSEDYSPPYSFVPPQMFALCNPCHGRLHKRFNHPPEEWMLFCRHVDAGGYGREFTAIYPRKKRSVLSAAIASGQAIEVNVIRPQAVKSGWWGDVSLDPESLDAPWARPRPWRDRPDEQSYRAALMAAKPTSTEWAILNFHARAHRRTVTMRDVAQQVLDSSRPQTANLAYGNLAKRIGAHLNWKPDPRPNGTPFWMSVIAESWNPPSSPDQPREFELVMIPTLANILRSEPIDGN